MPPAEATAQPALPGKAMQEPQGSGCSFLLSPRLQPYTGPRLRITGFIFNPSVVRASLRAKFRQEAIRGLSGCRGRLAAWLLNIKRQELGNV